jgi:predicted transcriptional regulator
MARRKSTPGIERERRRAGGALPSLVVASLRTPALTNLPPREQEIAAIVYLHTDVTAKDLETALSNAITNSAIRCMLSRLVAKGVLKRRKGQGKTFIYSPALLLPDIQERALERVAEDYFGGSLCQASHRLLTLVRKREPEAIEALSRQFGAGWAPAPSAVAHATRGSRAFG